MNATVKEWIAKAEADFSTATRELQAAESPNFDAVCFHAQQCAEKLMKALLIHLSVVTRDHLATLMVTHSMHQASSLGDRLIMMHRGKIIHDFSGAEKRRLRPSDLLARFEELRRAEQLDESAAQMLRRKYV